MTPPTSEGVYQCLAEVTIRNKRGLHARAAASFAQCADQFDAEILVTCRGHSVNANSVLGLVTFAAGPGTTILIETRGPDAEAALEALITLVESGFHEDDKGYSHLKAERRALDCQTEDDEGKDEESGPASEANAGT